jgi:hypothetical protein
LGVPRSPAPRGDGREICADSRKSAQRRLLCAGLAPNIGKSADGESTGKWEGIRRGFRVQKGAMSLPNDGDLVMVAMSLAGY